MNIRLKLFFRSVLLSLVPFFFFLNPVEAQSGRNIRFERISPEDGLSEAAVHCIIQDRQGFMWFGTQDGLNKFDGYSFSVYRNDPDNPQSLSDNFILSLLPDGSGVLWVGTAGKY